jgi:hypothetical protein
MSLSRRAFFATLGAAFAGVIGALKKLSAKPTIMSDWTCVIETGPSYEVLRPEKYSAGLFNPTRNVYADYYGQPLRFHKMAFALEWPPSNRRTVKVVEPNGDHRTVTINAGVAPCVFPNHAVFPRKPAAFNGSASNT